MSTLVENFIRRVEKLVPGRSTIPLPGTNHIDDEWLVTDIYPGEISINLESSSLYTSDGESIIDLNRENAILAGLVVQKDTSGVNKLSISSGEARIKGRTYFHVSSGTDFQLPLNLGSDPILYFIYGIPTSSIYSSGSSGNYLLGLTSSLLEGSLDEPGGIFSTITENENIPLPPDDGLMLGTVLLYPGASGFDLFPRSVSSLGDYFPKFSTTPSEFLRTKTHEVWPYEYQQLFFPGQFILDNNSNTVYTSKKTFISDNISVNNDVSLGNIFQIGITGFTGSTASYSSISVGSGVNVYKTTVDYQFQFRSLTASNLIVLTENADTISIGLTTSGLITAIENIGNGSGLYKGLTNTSVAQFKSLTAGSNNLIISENGDNIVIDVPFIGSSVSGAYVNGTSGSVGQIYAGMSGSDLTFRRLVPGTGITITQSPTSVNITAPGRNNQGVNAGGGPGFIYGGMSGDNLIFRSITGSTGVSVSLVGNSIIISASGSTGISSGINIGSTGSTVGQPLAGMSGSDLTFRSITTGYGLAITNIGNNIQLDSTILNGAQGPIGLTGFQGSIGFQGLEGPQGIMGSTGINGANGPQGFQGPGNLPGATGAVGPQGPAGLDVQTGILRFIDIYDNTGGATVTTSNSRILNFNISPERSNSDPTIFITGTISQTGPLGTYIEIAEDGDYFFVYNVSVIVPAGGYGKAYLYDYTNSLKVNGSDIWFSSTGGIETVTSTGKVALSGIQSGTQYVIQLESVSGTISTVVNSTSFFISKLETKMGPTGPSGLFFYQNSCPTEIIPGTISPGSFWYHSDTGIMYVRIYDSDSDQYLWVTPAIDCCTSNIPSFFYRDTCPVIEPGTIRPGSLWFHQETGNLFVYIFDPVSNQYVWSTPSVECCPNNFDISISSVGATSFENPENVLEIINQYSFTSNVSGGVSPYTYEWSLPTLSATPYSILSSGLTGSSLSIERTLLATDNDIFLIKVKSIDSKGNISKDTYLVSN